MFRRMTIAVTLVVLGTLSAGVLRAADQPSQAPYTEKQESVTEKVERAANTAAEKMERAAETASKEFSDSWITLKTKLSLFTDERVSGKDVHVTTRQRVIVLTGQVGTEEARLAAEEIAATIEGAKKVENHVVVVPKAAQGVDRKDGQTTPKAASRGTRV
jgi:osmotically-inducible protein OsmY